MSYTRPVGLIILDGFGAGVPDERNAIYTANTPFIDSLFNTYPHTTLKACGMDVGLPEGQMGNSEVGHLNIGAGRIVKQDFVKINHAIEDKSFYENEAFIHAFEHLSEGSALHIMGLTSHGGVHSELNHAYALIELAVQKGVSQVYFHAFLDGRDVARDSAIELLEELESKIKELTRGSETKVELASFIGRNYAMDRNKNWERTQIAYEAIVNPKPLKMSYQEKIKEFYNKDIFDQDIPAFALYNRGVKPGDSIIFFNFRNERARQLTQAFVEDEFSGFSRQKINDIYFVTLTEYDPRFEGLVEVAFKKEFPKNVLADVISEAGLTQYHSAETEKYAHVTFFINGGVEEPKAGETRVLVESPKVATYDLQPEMSAYEVTDKLVEAVQSDAYDSYIINYANGDMVGHTGNYQAVLKAIETLDECLSKLVPAFLEKDGIVLISADHGNADNMIDMESEEKTPLTQHSLNPVPFIVVSNNKNLKLVERDDARISDIAPTMLECIGLVKPEIWTGNSLIKTI